MEITIQNSPNDYKKFIAYYSLRRHLNRKIFLVLVLSLWLSAGVSKPFQLDLYIASFTLLSVILVLIIIIIPYFISKYRLQKTLSAKPYLLEKLTITKIESGINIVGDNYRILYRWEKIKFAESSDQYIYVVFLPDKSSLLIPKKYFNSHEEADSFYNKVFKNFERKLAQPNNKKGSHLYYWGLVGLLPNFGLIAGIILLYKGLFSYHNRKLVVIGIADILFTIAFWIVIIYETNHGNLFSDTNKMMAQTQINSIVKELEFYKIQNGSYPDSLEQIENVNGFIGIHDPFLSANEGNKADYTYKRVRDKYILFSIGADRAPNTNDDIYPTVTNGDTTKFGLIRR